MWKPLGSVRDLICVRDGHESAFLPQALSQVADIRPRLSSAPH